MTVSDMFENYKKYEYTLEQLCLYKYKSIVYRTSISVDDKQEDMEEYTILIKCIHYMERWYNMLDII